MNLCDVFIVAAIQAKRSTILNIVFLYSLRTGFIELLPKVINFGRKLKPIKLARKLESKIGLASFKFS